MLIFIVPSGTSGTNNKTAMRNSAVITFQFFFRNKMYGCIIVGKVIWHGLDLLFDTCQICAFFSNNKTFSCMFLSCCQFRIFSVSYRFQSSLYRNCILLAVFYSVNSSNCIRVPLAYAFSPESIIFSIGKNGICIHSVQREHSRIPAYRDDSHMAAFFCRFIHIFEMLRNSCMCIKAVYNIEPLCIFRCLYRKICCASAADDQNVDLVLHLLCFVHMADLSCLCKYFYCLRIAACKNCRKFQIRIVFHCTFHASAQVAISHDSNSNTHNNFLL